MEEGHGGISPVRAPQVTIKYLSKWKMQNSPQEWLIFLLLFWLFCLCYSSGCGMWHGDCSSWRRGVEEHHMSAGHIELQLKCVQLRYSPKHNNQPASFISSKTQNCWEQRGAVLKVKSLCKLADIQGDDCGDDQKSHCSVVHVKLFVWWKWAQQSASHILT